MRSHDSFYTDREAELDAQWSAYMGLKSGVPLTDVAIDKVFIGSCTNSRIEDLRAAAEIAKGRKVAPGVQALVVPGSGPVKAQAEAEGLDKIFIEAGSPMTPRSVLKPTAGTWCAALTVTMLTRLNAR